MSSTASLLSTSSHVTAAETFSHPESNYSLRLVSIQMLQGREVITPPIFGDVGNLATEEVRQRHV